MSAVAEAYGALLATGQLRADEAQAEVVGRLDALARQLEAPPRRGLLARLLPARAGPAPRSLYLWGGVGRGKSMLMDLLVQNLQFNAKKRIHFHEFMAETHARIHAHRQAQAGDPIPAVAALWAREARLLAFDELQVTNPPDAMILSRLFTALLAAGVTIIATSNRHPSDLYQDGLNRELFLPFIHLVLERFDVMALDGPTDYRRERIGGLPLYHVPNGPEASAALSELFFRLTDFPVEDRAHVPTAEIDLGGGRSLHVPKSLKGVAVFSWRKLIDAPHSAADYLAVARRYHTVFLVGVPILGPENRNAAMRFMAFVDAMYEYGVKLVMAADAPPDALYTAGDGAFEFQRTASRLEEMRSESWMARGHGLAA
ncbi:MAG: cell division protein ZapE [Thermaurantiacus sp.]